MSPAFSTTLIVATTVQAPFLAVAAEHLQGFIHLHHEGELAHPARA